jgi:hypothetical protein
MVRPLTMEELNSIWEGEYERITPNTPLPSLEPVESVALSPGPMTRQQRRASERARAKDRSAH